MDQWHRCMDENQLKELTFSKNIRLLTFHIKYK